MIILHATKKYLNALGGDTIVVSNLVKEQEERGHKTFILTSNCDEIKSENNVKKYGLKINSSDLDKINLSRIISLISLLIYSFFYIKKIKPDIVHSHSSDMGFILSFSCKFYGIPIVNTCHGITFNDPQYSILKRKLEIFLLKYAGFNKITTVDPNSLASFKEKKIDNTIYIPNGINLDDFERKSKTEKSKKAIRIIFVGRLEEQKGVSYLIDSIKSLTERKKSIELSIIGTGSEEKQLKNKTKDLNLEKIISFLGKKNNKEAIRYYFDSDIFVLPSIWEGFPLTLLEAWATNLPAVITRVGAVSKICKNGKNSLIIEPRKIDELTNAIELLLDNKSLRDKLGAEGRKLVEKQYNWAKISRDFEKMYLEVLK